jgi:hypothetical protein
MGPFVSVNYGHTIFCWAYSMLMVETVFCKVRFTSIMGVFTGVFFVSDKEWSSCLSAVFLITLGTGKLVYPTSIVFVDWVVITLSQ